MQLDPLFVISGNLWCAFQTTWLNRSLPKVFKSDDSETAQEKLATQKSIKIFNFDYIFLN